MHWDKDGCKSAYSLCTDPSLWDFSLQRTDIRRCIRYSVLLLQVVVGNIQYLDRILLSILLSILILLILLRILLITTK